MDYDYACFISYKRPPTPSYPPGVIPRKPTKHIWLQLAETFEQKLDQFLNTNVRIFRDEMLQPGVEYPKHISKSLCRSMCMVALVVPEYFESKWCRAEWAAMETFELGRLGKEKQELIIPVVCVGDIDNLKAFFGTRQGVDLRNIVSPSKQLNTLENLRKIASIASTINALANRLPPPDIDCDNYSLAIGLEEATPKVEEPSPFGR
jgi:hypothetical protein